MSPPPPLCLAPDPGPDPKLVFSGPGPQFLLPVRVLSLLIPILSPQFVFTGPGLRFILLIRNLNFYLLISGNGGSGSSNVSSSSNLFGIDNTNISILILVN